MNYGYNYILRPRKVGGFNPANLANTQFYSDPTIASSINAGSPSPADPVDTLGDLSPAGNDGTQAVVINQPVWNTTHITYATNDFINIDDVLTDITSSIQGTILRWVRPVDGTPTANENIISFGDTNADTFIYMFIATTGKLTAHCKIAGVNQWLIETDTSVFTTNVWGCPMLVMDGVSPVLYFNNVEYSPSEGNATFIVSTNTSKWFNDAPLLDNGRLSCRNKNLAGNDQFLNGDSQQTYISTDVKTTAVRTQLCNHNQP